MAAVTSAWRIRVSPTRNARAPAAARRSRSSGPRMPLSATTMRSDGTNGASCSVVVRSIVKRLEIAVVDADQPRPEPQCAVEFSGVVHFGQHVKAEFGRRCRQFRGQPVGQRRQDQQDAIGADQAAFENLIWVENEILAQHWQDDRLARGAQIAVAALEIRDHRSAPKDMRRHPPDRRAPGSPDRNRGGSARRSARLF